MHTFLLLSLLVLGTTEAFGQGTAPPPAPKPAPRAAQPVRRAAPVNTRGGMAITVTDPRGGILMGIQVEVTGPTDRQGETNSSGNLNFPGLQPGTYRLHFSGDEII